VAKAKYGSINLGGRGVIQTFGRGKNKVVGLNVSFRQIERWAKKMKIDTAKVMNCSFGRACSGLKKKFAEIVTGAGGVNGVPKFQDFEAFTKELRAAKGITRPMGGVLADKRHVVAFKRNKKQIIGWPDRLADWAVKFQDAMGDSGQLNDRTWRHYVHRLGVRDIPRTYARNPRRIIPQPFGDYVKKNLRDWARGAYYKELARKMMENAK
jgi:hypothetical protein